METIGIIAEYNPFHLGHAHQLSYLTDHWPDAIKIIVMSGSFVQRGMPAFFSKYDRAEWALLGGADIVLELPAVFALRSAEFFANGAIRLLAGLNIESFSFGSEVTNLDLLMKIADVLNSTLAQERTKELLKQGMSYGIAQRQAISEILPSALNVISRPNALLGIEYLRTLQKHGYDLTPIPVSRQGDYHSQTLQENEKNSPSATALRQALLAAKDDVSENLFTTSSLTNLQKYFPEDIGPHIVTCMEKGAYVDENRYADLIQFSGRTKTLEELATIGEFSEGIENRWKKGMQENSWSQSRDSIKSKRYSYSRLDRMAAYSVLNWSQDFLATTAQKGPLYARLLGFTEAGRNWLRGKEGSIPIVQKWAPFVKKSTGLTALMAQADILTTDIQSLCFTNPELRAGGKDFIYTPYYLK